MSESDIPVRRGRRDQSIAQAMIIDQPVSPDDDGQVETGLYGAISSTGEVAFAISKSLPDPVTNEERWFRMAYRDNPQDGEDTEDTADRVIDFVRLKLAQAVEMDNADSEAMYEERRRRPIVPRR